MMLCCIDFGHILRYIMESQLLSTLIALIGGSVIIERLNFKRNSEREMLKLLLKKVEKYDKMACLYWGTFLEECTKGPGKVCRDELAARLKTEYPFLTLTVDNIKLIANKKRIKESIQDLFDAATDSDFEVAKEFSKDEVRRTLVRIAKASATVKKELYDELLK